MKSLLLGKPLSFIYLIGLLSICLSTQAASFDCAKAVTRVEKLICSDMKLSKLDDELGAAYKTALSNTTESGKIRQGQRTWLKQRNKCSDVLCIDNAYRSRLRILSQFTTTQKTKTIFKRDNAQTTHPYFLVMSKSNKLCHYMVDLYNADMNSYGEIKYNSHKIFSRIVWKDINRVGRDPFTVPEEAVFDINNDGKKEVVIKTNWPVFKAFIDTLFIFPSTSDVISRLKPGPDGERALFTTKNILFRSRSRYFLRQASKRSLLNGGRKCLLADSFEGVGPSFVFKPFIFEGTTYISMTDLDAKWIVIGKYIKEDKVHDMCYLRKYH